MLLQMVPALQLLLMNSRHYRLAALLQMLRSNLVFCKPQHLPCSTVNACARASYARARANNCISVVYGFKYQIVRISRRRAVSVFSSSCCVAGSRCKSLGVLPRFGHKLAYDSLVNIC